MDKITYDEALGALREAVNHRGEDYAYYDHFPACFYFGPATGNPLCIVGEVSTRLPRNRTEVTNLLSEYNECEFMVGSIPDLQEYFTEDAINLLYQAQIQQDFGVAWGEAVRIAEVGSRG